MAPPKARRAEYAFVPENDTVASTLFSSTERLEVFVGGGVPMQPPVAGPGGPLIDPRKVVAIPGQRGRSNPNSPSRGRLSPTRSSPRANLQLKPHTLERISPRSKTAALEAARSASPPPS